MTTYVFGDIGGRADELQALIAQLPEKDAGMVFVGDFVDRGPKSKEVLELLMAHPEWVALYGNHEDLLLNDEWTWTRNGGNATLRSFGVSRAKEIPEKFRKWIAALPWSHVVEEDGKKFFISHAPPIDPENPWHEEPQALWSRNPPPYDPKFDLLIFGHNGRLHWYETTIETLPKKYAVCIDDSRSNVLTAIELPSLKIFQQPYLS